jgi:hypothetical protein
MAKDLMVFAGLIRYRMPPRVLKCLRGVGRMVLLRRGWFIGLERWEIMLCILGVEDACG